MSSARAEPVSRQAASRARRGDVLGGLPVADDLCLGQRAGRPCRRRVARRLAAPHARPWMSLFDPQRIVAEIRKDGGLPIVKICGFRHRVAWPVQDASGWILAEDDYPLGGPVETRTSHGVCPDCTTMLAEAP